jgi:hypothetical protein
MSEWLKAHAWKAIVASITKQHRDTLLRIRFNDLRRQDAPRYEPVNLSVCRRFRGHLTQFLHNSQFHLLVYVTMFLGTLRGQGDNAPRLT